MGICSDNNDLDSEIIVIGRNYGNILATVRDFGEAGYFSHVLRVFKNPPKKLNLLGKIKPDSYSKYVTGFDECIVNQQPKRILEDLLALGNMTKKKLLVPVDDYCVYFVDLYYDQLEQYFYIPSVEEQSEGIIKLMNKERQKKIAKLFDVPVLGSTVVNIDNGEIEYGSSVRYPCFVKPNISVEGTKAHMAKCDDQGQLEEHLVRYAKGGRASFIVEDYADIENEFSVIGLALPQDVKVAGVFRVLEGGHKERTGVSISGEIVEMDKFRDIIKKCTAFIKDLKYTGLFDIDLIETKDGKVYFIELNFRAGASARVFTEEGRNFPGMLADYMLKKQSNLKETMVSTVGRTFVSEKVLLEEYVRSDVKWIDVKTYLKKADVFFIKDDKDPQPYEYFKRAYIVASILRIPYRIRDNIKNRRSKV